MDKNIGAMLDGRYEIQKRIGVGGMADVYMAYDIEESREVAVKILKNEFINNDEFLRRFKNESKAVSMLSHPNIVKILDVGFNDDVRFIVMEYIDGITLRDYIEKEGRVDWKEASHLIIQILRALQHAHDRGIIHRDIKPQNIMMFEDGTIKVMDFGIAKFTYELGITATAQTIGSVHYISPEQACGKPIDGKSDIYSVGILMYEMLTGKKPFDTDNPVTVALMQMQNKAELPRNINPNIPEGMEEIVLKAIEKDPDNRYQSANDMIKDIERFKSYPDMVFGYYENTGRNYQTERAYQSERFSSSRDQERESYNEPDNDTEELAEANYYVGDNNEENAEDKGKKSTFVKVASAATVIVIILVVAGIIGLINNIIKGGNDKSQFDMPDLTRYDYTEMVEKYKDKLNIQIKGDPVYSQYVENTIVSQSVDVGTKVTKGITVYVTVSNGKNISVVPDVSGLTSEEAVTLINKNGFSVEQKQIFNDEIPFNTVIRVSPESGTEMEISNIVILYVSKGAQTDARIVPDVVGKTKEVAVKMLEDAGFKVSVEEKDSKEPKDTVISQNLQADTLASPDEKVIIYVSSGKAPVSEVPIIIDFPENASGTFKFIAYEDDKIVVEKKGVNAAEAISVKLDISGSETKTIRIELHNTENGMSADIGTYKFDFEQKKYDVINQDIAKAFEAVEGIKKPVTIQTQAMTTAPPVTTTHITEKVTESAPLPPTETPESSTEQIPPSETPAPPSASQQQQPDSQ